MAFFAPLLAWFIQLNASYMLATYACQERVWLLHTISFAAIALASLGLIVGVKSWRLYQKKGPKTKEFLALGVWLIGATLLITVMAGELSNLMLEPCQ